MSGPLRIESLKKIYWVLCFFLLVAGVAMLPSCHSARANSHTDQRLIILGIDGMDPQLLHRFMREGKMPNFAKLEARYERIAAQLHTTAAALDAPSCSRAANPRD